MLNTETTPTAVNVFHPIDGIETATAVAYDDILSNIKNNVKTYGSLMPRLHKLPEFHKVKGKDKPIAIVGGGPTIKHYIDDIRQYRTVMAAGSCHDYLRENNINITYTAVCDPDPIVMKYLQKPDTETKYLLASGCDSAVYEHLKDHQRVMWHCHSDTYKPDEIEPEYQGVGGGCTVGLRALNIAILLGYSNVHLFGMDSCMGESSHAYEAEDVGKIYDIAASVNKTTAPTKSKVWKVAGYQLAQAYQFIDFYSKWHMYFTPTIFGDSLLADIMKNININMQLLDTQGVKQ